MLGRNGSKMSEEKKDIKEISKQLVEAAGKKGCITYAEIIDILEKHQLFSLIWFIVFSVTSGFRMTS